MAVLLALAAIGCRSEVAPEHADAGIERQPDAIDLLPKLADLPLGWSRIEPGEPTVCSDGSAYSFFVRHADSDKLMLYLQGGGGCWFPENCSLQRQPSYRFEVGDTDPAAAGGILAFDNPENPFTDYNVVFVPYCTGDVHLGGQTKVYQVAANDESPAHDATVRHLGHTNATTVLEWAFRNFESPQTVFVTGSSAGSIPSPYYAHLVAEHYPLSRVEQLGDGAGGYRRQTESLPHESWGTMEVLAAIPEFASMEPADFNYEKLYVVAALHHPDASFAAYDTAEDEVQLRFLALSGAEVASLQPLIDANQADIRAEVDNYHSFVAGGDVHTILLRPEFYTYRVGGVRLRDWVAALAAGEEVADVHCDDCAVAETVETTASDVTPTGP